MGTPPLDIPSLTYRVFRWLYLPALLCPFLLAVSRALRKDTYSAVSFFIFSAITAHEGAVGFGLIDAEFFSKYHHLLAGFCFALVIVRRATAVQAAEQAEASHMIKLAHMARSVAHDIRSPLTAMAAALDGVHLSEDRKYLIDNAVRRINAIAEDLLGDTNHEKREKRKALHHLPSVIATIIDEKKIEGRQREDIEISLVCEVDANDAWVLLDSSQLHRSISNVVNNAFEAMPNGGCVTVSLRREGQSWAVSVRDTGSGMPPEFLAQLGEKSVSHKRGGHGIGVHEAYVFAQSSQGDLRYESEHGVGTTATFKFPVQAPPPEQRFIHLASSSAS